MKLIVDVKDNAEDKDIREAIISATELVKECIGLEEERDLLDDENVKMAMFLRNDGYTTDDIYNIAKGFPIDKGGKYEANN
jgi:hypothetical protein